MIAKHNRKFNSKLLSESILHMQSHKNNCSYQTILLVAENQHVNGRDYDRFLAGIVPENGEVCPPFSAINREDQRGQRATANTLNTQQNKLPSLAEAAAEWQHYSSLLSLQISFNNLLSNSPLQILTIISLSYVMDQTICSCISPLKLKNSKRNNIFGGDSSMKGHQ